LLIFCCWCYIVIWLSISFLSFMNIGLPKHFINIVIVVTLLWEECEDKTHTPEMGTWESAEIPETLEFDCRGQNTSHWGFLYIMGNISKHRCRKWVRMSHLDIYNTSYGKKKRRESNWQFDSRPPKVGNWPDPEECRWSATCHWKALDKNYKFALNLIPIGGLGKELWLRKVAGVQTEIVSGLLLGSLGIKNHSDVGATERRKEYYMGEGAKRHRKCYMGEGGGFLRIRAVVSLVSPEPPMAYPSIKGALESELLNLLVGWM
jgi:hypothetical protein